MKILSSVFVHVFILGLVLPAFGQDGMSRGSGQVNTAQGLDIRAAPAPRSVSVCTLSVEENVQIASLHVVNDPNKTKDPPNDAWLKYFGVYAGDENGTPSMPSIKAELDESASQYRITGYTREGTSIPGRAIFPGVHIAGTMSFDLDVAFGQLKASSSDQQNLPTLELVTTSSDFPKQFQHLFFTAYAQNNQPASGSLYIDALSFELTSATTLELVLECKSLTGTSYAVPLTADSTRTIWTSNGPVEIKQV